jgi:hypothetical protein
MRATFSGWDQSWVSRELDFAIRTGMLQERVAARSASPIGQSLKKSPGEGMMPKRFAFEPSPCRFAAFLSRRERVCAEP